MNQGSIQVEEIIESLEVSNLEKNREISKLKLSVSKLETEKKLLQNSAVEQTDGDNNSVRNFQFDFKT